MRQKLKYFLFSLISFAIVLASMDLLPRLFRTLSSRGVMLGGMDRTDVAILAQLIVTVVILILFGLIWFRRSAVFPPKNTETDDSIPKRIPRKIISILILGFSMFYFNAIIIIILAIIMPDRYQAYNSFFTGAMSGTEWLTIMYAVILGPMLEETVFRGLVFGYARKVFPVWFALIYQAALFGIYHENLVQGIYAFILGLFLGFICLKGPGIRYSIPCHMLFNFIGFVLMGYLADTLGNIYYLAIIGIGVTIFAMLLLNSTTKVKKKPA